MLPHGDDWLGVTDAPLPVGEALAWSITPGVGAQVVFTGSVRDHADGRSDVEAVTYEAYEEQVVPRLEEVVAELRARWPQTGRVAMWHRTGRLPVGEISVLVVVSAPHRGEAFEAARFGIDTLKVSLPVWKDEEWAGGRGWGTDAATIEDVGSKR